MISKKFKEYNKKQNRLGPKLIYNSSLVGEYLTFLLIVEKDY